MKKTFLVTVVIAMGLFACAQTPPASVSDTFNKKFKSATDIEWEQEEDNEWEVEFKMNGTEMSACFEALGKWLETEAEVKAKDLPAEVHKAINIKFDGWEIDEVESIEKPDFKGYEIVLEKEDTETEVLVTASGEITIKKVKVEEDDDDEEHED